MSDYNISAKITGNSKGYVSAVDEAKKATKKLSTSVSDIIKGLGSNGLVGALGAVGLASQGLTATLGTVVTVVQKVTKTVSEWTETYKVQLIAERQLDSAIKNSPLVDGTSSKALKDFASEIQSVSNYGDEQLIPMIADLIAKGRTEAETMKIISTAVDMSASGTVSLETAISQLNMTMNGSIGRLGMQNKELKDLTKEELESGRAVDILADKFKGLASATVDTSKQLQNVKGDFKEALGEFTLPSSDVWNNFWKGFYDRGTVVLKRINDSLQLKADYKATKAYVDSYAEAFKHMKPVERSAEWAKITAGLDDQNVKYMTEALQKQLQKQGGLKTLEREFLEALENEVLIRREIEIEQEKAKKKTSENISDEEIINQLKEKYLKKIAEQETKWVNIEKVTKETVKTEEKLNFYQEQLVAIMTESGGMITENNQYYKDQIKIIDSLKKSLKGNEVQVEENTEKLSTFFSELKEGVEEYIDDIKNASNAWVKAFSDVSGIMQQSLQKVFEQLGKDLASGKTSWKNYARIAVDAVKEILIALAAQLTALTAVKIVTESYAEAAVAGAGAVAAGVAAGSLEVVSEKLGEEAKEVENVSKAATNAESNLSKLAKTTEDVKNVTQSLNQSIKETLSAQNAVADFATTSKSIQSLITQQKTAIEAEKKTIEELTNKLKELEAQSSLDLLNPLIPITNVLRKAYIKLELKRAQEAYDNATASLGKLNQQLVFQEINLRSSLREQISQLKQISNSYKIIYDKDRKSGGFLETANLDQRLSIVNKISSTFQSLSQYGMEIGESLVSNISMGISKADWKETLRDKVRTSLIELSVYTESFTTKLAQISSQLVTQIITDNYDVTENIVKEYEKLYDTVEKKVENIDKVLDKAFGKKSSQTLTKFEEKIKSIKESFSDFGAELGDSFVNAINDGVSESSFLDTMKKWIRKNLIQTVVFTKSMQTEIEAIGQAISKGISEGFTDTSLHEIRRDLSWVFYNTNKTMSQIDTLLNGVFSGYATGSQSVPKGLALVGESGPELVKFRGGEQVLNSHNTQKALQSAGNKTINQNITFNNLQDTSAYAMIQQLKQYNRQMALNSII